MIARKTITLNDLKYYYDTRHGFVFHPADDRHVETLANMLLKVKATDSLPEFVTHLNGSTIFVYPEICEFHSGPVYQFAQGISQMMPVGRLEILNAWLKSN
jgi:hypothetical protein